MASSLFHTLNISKTDLLSRLNALDVTSHNLANVNTAGYKTNRSNFQEIFQQKLKEGTQLQTTQLITTQGSLRDSTNPLDWAIEGDGYFSVTLPDGQTGYTRDGQFMVDTNMQLVTTKGYPVVWDGALTDGMTNISVSADGVVSAKDIDGADVTVGTVQLTRFPNDSGLKSYGENVWLETVDSGAAATGTAGTENYGTIHGNRVEQSNIDIAREMTNLITMQRTFSMSIKAFQQTDTMITEAINLRKA